MRLRSMCGKFTQMISWGAYVSLTELLNGVDGSANDRSEIVSPMLGVLLAASVLTAFGACGRLCWRADWRRRCARD